MIGKVTSKYRCHVQIGTLCRSSLVHFGSQRRSHRLKYVQFLRTIRLHKERHRCKIHSPLFTESLHGIEHTIPLRHTFPYVHGHTTCCMYEQRLFPTLHHGRNQFLQSRILDHDQIDIGIGTYFLQRCNKGNFQPGSQFRSRFNRPAIYLCYFPTSLLQSKPHMCRHIAGSYQHDSLIVHHTC